MPDSGVTNQTLDQILARNVSASLNRGAAAALTVAFQIRKADHLSRGENTSDDLIAQEIQKIYLEMMALTDPDAAMAKAKAKVQAAKAAEAKPRMPPDLTPKR